MLEILGWLGCLYLLVKGIEIIGNQSNQIPRKDRDETYLSPAALIAALLAIAGALIFPFLLSAQAGGVMSTLATAPSPSAQLTQEEVDCINNAGGDTQRILNCSSSK